VRTPVSVGIVGGHPSAEQIALAFAELPQAEVRWLCGEWRATGLSRRLGVRSTERVDELLEDEELDAIALAAPAGNRYRLASDALEADKHVYVVGAPAKQSEQAGALLRQAQDRGRHLFGGHSRLWDPALEKLEELLRAGELGEVLYLRAERHICGRTANEDDLLWGAGAEEVAVILHLLGDEPVSVEARGETFLDPAAFDVLHCWLAFATGITAQVTLSALDASPASQLALVGSNATAVLDSSPSSSTRRLSVCRKGVSGPRTEGTAFVPGDVFSPQTGSEDPVRRSCEAFLSAIRSASAPIAAGREAAILVETLEGIQRSLVRGGSINLGLGRPAKDLRLVGGPSAS